MTWKSLKDARFGFCLQELCFRAVDRDRPEREDRQNWVPLYVRTRVYRYGQIEKIKRCTMESTKQVQCVLGGRCLNPKASKKHQ